MTRLLICGRCVRRRGAAAQRSATQRRGSAAERSSGDCRSNKPAAASAGSHLLDLLLLAVAGALRQLLRRLALHLSTRVGSFRSRRRRGDGASRAAASYFSPGCRLMWDSGLLLLRALCPGHPLLTLPGATLGDHVGQEDRPGGRRGRGGRSVRLPLHRGRYESTSRSPALPLHIRHRLWACC